MCEWQHAGPASGATIQSTAYAAALPAAALALLPGDDLLLLIGP